MARQTRCIDCNEVGRITDRPAYKPGPRCDEHWRAKRKAVSKRLHGKRIEENYGIDSETYWAIYEAQGGKCAVCQVSTGKTKRLAVDHDHNCSENWNNKEGGHDPKMGCRKCIRCLACGRCNQEVLIHPVEALQRAIEIRTDPPAQRVLKLLEGRSIPDE